jgi:hypothetical protein
MNVMKKMPENEMVQKPTKTTVSLPADLGSEIWDMIAEERRAGRRVTQQDILLDALRCYFAGRKKAAVA